MLQSPIVACLNNEYPASLSSFDTVLAGCHERTNSAVSLNFFYQLSPIFSNIPLIQTLDSLIDRNNENLDFNKHTKVRNPTTSIIIRQTHPNKSNLSLMLLLLQLLLLQLHAFQMCFQCLQVLRIHFQIIRIFFHHTTSFSGLYLTPNLLFSTHNPALSIHKPRSPSSKHEVPALNPLEPIEFIAFIAFIAFIELIELIEVV